MKATAVAIMLKYPVPGSVKTRLAPLLTPKQAAQFSICLIKDTFNNVRKLKGADIFAASYPSGLKKEVEALTGSGARHIDQRGDNLGERLCNVFDFLFSKGYLNVVVIGIDSPDMPVELITKAFKLLDTGADVVLGPAFDGGYYLIALKRPAPALFDAIDWGSSNVLENTIENALEQALKVELLRKWHDIDRPEDLLFLKDNPQAAESSKFLSLCGVFKNICSANQPVN
ncbi:glycosyltransferase [bacterium]|nr:MAG: glycosyltransferase [bacterium]